MDNVQLSPRQRQLVEANVGLVAVHIRRNVRGLGQPNRTREWEDLFQEGCIGLIRAARRWDAGSGIPFPAYALPRIHAAVSHALENRFTLVRLPRCSGSDPAQVARRRERAVTVVSMTDDPPDRRTERAAVAAAGREMISDRLREKYQAAVRRAGASFSRGRSRRSDRVELINRLIEEWLLVPKRESRIALRQLAREMKSSYARVAQCAKRLEEIVRDLLAEDEEFRVLSEESRGASLGTSAPVDADMERVLDEARMRRFVRRFGGASPEQRGVLLLRVLEASGEDVNTVAEGWFRRLPRSAHSALLNDGFPETGGASAA